MSQLEAACFCLSVFPPAMIWAAFGHPGDAYMSALAGCLVWAVYLARKKREGYRL